jgi:hypothetical protein
LIAACCAAEALPDGTANWSCLAVICEALISAARSVVHIYLFDSGGQISFRITLTTATAPKK